MKITIIQKRIMALSMILLFLSIHFAKLFHCHEEKQPFSKNTSYKTHTEICKVCDYHFSANAVCVEAPELACFGQYTVKSTSGFTFYIPSSIGLVNSDRGPPSIL